ncbi:MAG: hypothetical protein AB7R63_01015 [Phycisphaerales bacterium]
MAVNSGPNKKKPRGFSERGRYDGSSPIFVGRDAEVREFIDWVAEEPPTDGMRAAVLVGSAGRGKTRLLQKFEEICVHRPGPTWHVVYRTLNENKGVAEFFDDLLRDMHALLVARPLRAGPHDDRLRDELLKAIPKAGSLLTALIGNQKLTGGERFVEYLRVVSSHIVPKNERFVVLVDPKNTVASAQAAEWMTIASLVPANVRIVIAQRPDDVVAGHSERRLRFRSMPSEGALEDLSEVKIQDWYDAEFAAGRLQLTPSGRVWDSQTRQQLGEVAFQRYGGYPLAHEAVIRLVASATSEQPLQDIQSWPRAVAALMDMLFGRLADLGEEQLRAGLALRVFGIATPMEIWAEGAGVPTERLMSWLTDPRFMHFFARDERGQYAPFHALFAERLVNALRYTPQRTKEIAEIVWSTIEPALDKTRLATSLAPVF